jgi:hypothetical protein
MVGLDYWARERIASLVREGRANQAAEQYGINQSYAYQAAAEFDGEPEEQREVWRKESVRKARLDRLAAWMNQAGFSIRQIRGVYYFNRMHAPDGTTMAAILQEESRILGFQMRVGEGKENMQGHTQPFDSYRRREPEVGKIAAMFMHWNKKFHPRKVKSEAQVHLGMDYQAILHNQPPPKGAEPRK